MPAAILAPVAAAAGTAGTAAAGTAAAGAAAAGTAAAGTAAAGTAAAGTAAAGTAAAGTAAAGTAAAGTAASTMPAAASGTTMGMLPELVAANPAAMSGGWAPPLTQAASPMEAGIMTDALNPAISNQMVGQGLGPLSNVPGGEASGGMLNGLTPGDVAEMAQMYQAGQSVLGGGQQPQLMSPGRGPSGSYQHQPTGPANNYGYLDPLYGRA